MKNVFVRRRLLGLASTAVTLAVSFVGLSSTALAASGIPTPECPATIHCTFVPAAYHQNSTVDDYGNFDVANRPADGMAINQIVWHDTEGDCPEAIQKFQDPLAYVSAHYLICTNPNGSVNVVQMVETKNVAWHAGNYGVNMHSIGVEIAGFAVGEYQPQTYWVASQLGTYLAGRFHIQLDAQHMGGHDSVPPPNSDNVGLQHMDPGPFFNWQLFYGLLGVRVYTGGNPLNSTVVTVAPAWPLNKQTVTGCFPNEPTQCANTSSRPTSITYVHTAPAQNSPLVSDPVLGPGTTEIGNEVAKIHYGQKFVAFQHQMTSDGVWYQIYYNGQTGWVFSPWANPTVFAGKGQRVTPKQGVASVPVYGRAYPASSTYPPGFTGPAAVSLPYVMLAGQSYTLAQADVLTQWYNNATIDYSQPYDHAVFTSHDLADQYVAVQFGGRFAFVKKSDVVVG